MIVTCLPPTISNCTLNSRLCPSRNFRHGPPTIVTDSTLVGSTTTSHAVRPINVNRYRFTPSGVILHSVTGRRINPATDATAATDAAPAARYDGHTGVDCIVGAYSEGAGGES